MQLLSLSTTVNTNTLTRVTNHLENRQHLAKKEPKMTGVLCACNFFFFWEILQKSSLDNHRALHRIFVGFSRKIGSKFLNYFLGGAFAYAVEWHWCRCKVKRLHRIMSTLHVHRYTVEFFVWFPTQFLSDHVTIHSCRLQKRSRGKLQYVPWKKKHTDRQIV